MTLQNKTLLIISSCVIATLAAIYLISKNIVTDRFQELENNYARENVRRVTEVLNTELNFLSSISGLYSSQEIINPIIQHGEDQSFSTNAINALHKENNDLFAVFQANKKPIILTSDNSNINLPEAWLQPMSPEHPLSIPRDSNGRAQGIIKLSNGNILMSASRPTPPGIEGLDKPATIIIGNVIDSEEIQRLSRISKMSLNLIDLNSVNPKDEDYNFFKSLTVNAPNRIRIQDDYIINGYLLLRDVRNRPAFVLEVSLPRDISLQGKASINYFSKILIIVGAVMIFIVLLLVSQLVLSRLRRLENGIYNVYKTGDLSSHVEMDGNDELKKLADIFNELLDWLNLSRERLEEQINERISAEEELKLSEERFNRAELLGKLGHWEWNEIDDCLINCSEQYALIFGMNVNQALLEFTSMEKDLERIQPDDRERVRKVMTDANESKSGFDIEYRIVTYNGERRHVQCISEPVLDRHGVLVRSNGTLQDITRKKQVQDRLELYQNRLRVLMSELALAEEQERRKIADGLHDSTIQNLGLSKFKLSVFQNSLPDNISTSMLEEVIHTIDKAIKDTRSLVFELSPPILYELGFVPAIEWLAEQFYLQRGLVCEVYNDDQDKPLGTSTMVSLFQIIRELLINISKHAKASKSSILIDRVDDKIRIQVIDNGIGFDVSSLDDPDNDPGGYGLFSIRERLSNISEELNIESVPGEGTKITFSVPLKLDVEVAV